MAETLARLLRLASGISFAALCLHGVLMGVCCLRLEAFTLWLGALVSWVLVKGLFK